MLCGLGNPDGTSRIIVIIQLLSFISRICESCYKEREKREKPFSFQTRAQAPSTAFLSRAKPPVSIDGLFYFTVLGQKVSAMLIRKPMTSAPAGKNNLRIPCAAIAIARQRDVHSLQ